MARDDVRRTLTGNTRTEGPDRVYEVREERTIEVRVPLDAVRGKPARAQAQEVTAHGRAAGWK